MSTLKQHITETIQLCHELMTVIHAETTAVRQRDMAKVPDLAKQKDRLTTQLENMLARVKEHLAAEGDRADAAPLLAELQLAVSSYDHAARQNLLVLQAAHQATSIFLDSVRQAVAKPKAETYGSKGSMTEKAEKTALINKSI